MTLKSNQPALDAAAPLHTRPVCPHRLGLGWAKSLSFATGQCPVLRYHAKLARAIMYDKIKIARAVRACVVVQCRERQHCALACTARAQPWRRRACQRGARGRR